jgi:hypothetical protein
MKLDSRNQEDLDRLLLEETAEIEGIPTKFYLEKLSH